MAASDPSLLHQQPVPEGIPAEDPLGLKQPLLPAQLLGINQQFLVPLGARSLSVLDPYLISSNPIQADFLDNPFQDSPFFPTSQPVTDTTFAGHPDKANVSPVDRTPDPSAGEVEKSEFDGLQLPFSDTKPVASPENHFNDQINQSGKSIQPQRSSTSVPSSEIRAEQTIQFQQPPLSIGAQPIHEPTLQPQLLPGEVPKSQPDLIALSEPPEPSADSTRSLCSSVSEVQLSQAPAEIEAPVKNFGWETQDQLLQSPSKNAATNPQIIAPIDRETEPFTEIQAENSQQEIQAQQTDQLEFERLSMPPVDSKIPAESTSQSQNTLLTSETSSVEEFSEARSTSSQPTVIEQPLIQTDITVPDVEVSTISFASESTEAIAEQSGSSGIEQLNKTADELISQDADKTIIQASSEILTLETSNTNKSIQLEKTINTSVSQDAEQVAIQASLESFIPENSHINNPTEDRSFTSSELLKSSQMERSDSTSSVVPSKEPEISDAAQVSLSNEANLQTQPGKQAQVSSPLPAAELSTTSSFTSNSTDSSNLSLSRSLPPQPINSVSAPKYTVEASILQPKQEAPPSATFEQPVNELSVAVQDPLPTPDILHPLTEQTSEQILQRSPSAQTSSANISAQAPLVERLASNPQSVSTSESVQVRRATNTTNELQITSEPEPLQSQLDISPTSTPSTRNFTESSNELSITEPLAESLPLQKQTELTDPTNNNLVQQFTPLHQPFDQTKPSTSSTQFKTEQSQSSDLATESASASQGVVRQFFAQANQFISRAVDFLSEKDGADGLNTSPKARTSSFEPSSQRQEDLTQREAQTPELNFSLPTSVPLMTDSAENSLIAQPVNQSDPRVPLTTSSISSPPSSDSLMRLTNESSVIEKLSIQAQADVSHPAPIKQSQAGYSATTQKTSATLSVENQAISTNNLDNQISSGDSGIQVSQVNIEAAQSGNSENRQTSAPIVPLHLSEEMEQAAQFTFSDVVSPPLENKDLSISETVNQGTVQPSSHENEVDDIQIVGALEPEVQLNRLEASQASLETSQVPSSNNIEILRSTQLEDSNEGQQSLIELVETATSIPEGKVDPQPSTTSATKTSDVIQTVSEISTPAKTANQTKASTNITNLTEAIADPAGIQRNAEPLSSLSIVASSAEETNTAPNATETSPSVSNSKSSDLGILEAPPARLSVETPNSMTLQVVPSLIRNPSEVSAPPEQITQAKIQGKQETVEEQPVVFEKPVLNNQEVAFQAQPENNSSELQSEVKTLLDTSKSQPFIQAKLATDVVAAQPNIEVLSSEKFESQSSTQAELLAESIKAQSEEMQPDRENDSSSTESSLQNIVSDSIEVSPEIASHPIIDSQERITQPLIQRSAIENFTPSTIRQSSAQDIHPSDTIPQQSSDKNSESSITNRFLVDGRDTLTDLAEVTTGDLLNPVKPHNPSSEPLETSIVEAKLNIQESAQPSTIESTKLSVGGSFGADQVTKTAETQAAVELTVDRQVEPDEIPIETEYLAGIETNLSTQPASNHPSPLDSDTEFTSTESSIQRSVEKLETEPIESQAEKEGKITEFTGNQVAEIQGSVQESGAKPEIWAGTEIGIKRIPTENQAVEIQRLTQQLEAKPVEIQTAIDGRISQATDSLETTIAPFEKPAVENFLLPPVGQSTGDYQTNAIAPLQANSRSTGGTLGAEVNQQIQRQPESNAVESLKNLVVQDVQFNQINHLQTDAVGFSADNRQMSEVSSATKTSSPLADSSLSTSSLSTSNSEAIIQRSTKVEHADTNQLIEISSLSTGVSSTIDSKPVIQRSAEEEIGRELEKIPQLPQVLQDLRVLQPLSRKQISGQATPAIVQTKGYTNEPASSAFSSASMSSLSSATPDQSRLQPSTAAFNPSLSTGLTQPLPSQWSSLAELAGGYTAPIQRSSVRKSTPAAKSVQSNSVLQAQSAEQSTPIRVTRNQPPTPVMAKQEATVESNDDGEETDYLEMVAQSIYDRLRQRLRVEQERHGHGYSGRLPW